MKKVIFFTFLILFSHCGKPNYPKIDASFERFDTSLLKYIDNHGNFLSDGSYVEVGETSKGGYFYYKAPKNSYYRELLKNITLMEILKENILPWLMNFYIL